MQTLKFMQILGVVARNFYFKNVQFVNSTLNALYSNWEILLMNVVKVVLHESYTYFSLWGY